MSLVKINIKVGNKNLAKGVLQRFSVNTCFLYNNSKEEINCLKLVAEHLLSIGNKPALYGNGRLLDYFLQHTDLKNKIKCILTDKNNSDFKTIALKDIPGDIDAVLICDPITFRRWQMEKNVRKINPAIKIISPEILQELNWQMIPERGWVDAYDTIYPIEIPEIKFDTNNDLILIDAPSRNLDMLPNGLGYVHEALKKTGINFQTVDLDVIFYHRFHSFRLFDTPNARVVLPSGKELPEDLWKAEFHAFWKDQEMIDFLSPWIDEVVSSIVDAKPKILALSVHECNAKISEEIVRRVKKQLQNIIILAGGYNCRYPSVGFKAFSLADYIAIGEVDLSLAPFIRKLLADETVKDMSGFLSRYDSPNWLFEPGPLPENLDQFGFPKFEWTNIQLYRNWNHYQLTPVHATRGCCWGRCRFCVETAKFRTRSAKSFVDEIEWLYHQGRDLFMFNESDMNGDPQLLLNICDEVIRRKLFVRFTGQLRIDKRNTKEFFEKLHKAGVVSLRFGVDAWCPHTLKLQNKGYTTEMISQNLRDCKAAGIFIEVNAVIGVPGETEEDIDDTIRFLIENKSYIDRIASLSPLMLKESSDYWNHPEKYSLCFRGDREELCYQYNHVPNGMPDDFWYSENPYIDALVRKKRFERVVLALGKNGFDMADFAREVIKEVDADTYYSDKEKLCNSRNNVSNVIENYDNRLQKSDFKNLHHTQKYLRFYFNHNIYKFGQIEAKKILELNNARQYHVSMCPLSFNTRLSGISVENSAQLFSNIRSKLFFFIQNKIFTLLKKFGFISLDELKIISDLESVDVCLQKEGVCGYNILKVSGQYVALKQGYPFDVERMKYNTYPPGVLLLSQNIKDLVAKISHEL